MLSCSETAHHRFRRAAFTSDGIIPDESAASPTLKRAEGVTETVLCRDIAELSGSRFSLMPEGMESGITVE